MVQERKLRTTNLVQSSVNLHWNEPTAMRFAVITKGTNS